MSEDEGIIQPTPYGTVPWGKVTGKPSLVPTSRNILTTTPLSGGGDLSADRTLSIALRLIDIPDLSSLYAALAGSPVFTSALQAFQVTTTQKNAISNPTEGIIVYDTTLHKLCVRGVAGWETITSA